MSEPRWDIGGLRLPGGINNSRSAECSGCALQAQRIADLEAALAEARDEIRQHDLWREEAERQIAERTSERDEFDATLRSVEAAIAEVYPTWLDAEDYADAVRRLGQERDAERAVRETAEKEAHQHAEREAELYKERDALRAELDLYKPPVSIETGGTL